MNKLSEILNNNCLFKTDRISIINWSYVESHCNSMNSITNSILNILSPNVTKALPDGWQHIDNADKAENWILDRKNDSNFYVIELIETNEIIGFLFLYENQETKNSNHLRLGYLLTESIWGKGIGTELIKGLVKWSQKATIIDSISGGVEKDNIGSIKALEKNGFYKSKEKLPGNTLLYKIDFN